MFKDLNSSAIVAVRDLAGARAFYGETLGLELSGDTPEVLSFRTGTTLLMVYRSDLAGTNQANAVVWGAGASFDAVVAELRGKGVRFEEYPGMGIQIVDGVHVDGGFKGVWFKDPDGNILHFNNM